MRKTNWQSLVIPLDGLVNSENWMVVCRAVEDRIVSALCGTSFADHIETYAVLEGMPAPDGADPLVHQTELINEARTLFNYNESLPAYVNAMSILADNVGKDFNISESNDRTIVVLIEDTK